MGRDLRSCSFVEFDLIQITDYAQYFMINLSTGVWKEMLHVLEEYSAKYGQLQVLFGPVFDYNADGLNDSVSELQQ